MSDVKELEINSTVYNIVGKAVVDQNNATPLKQWSGTKAQYDALVSGGTVDVNTIYNITDDVSGLSNVYTKTETDGLLNAKVDLDGSWSFPSGTYDELTLGSDGTTYTAPADGYFTWQKTTNGTNQYFGMVNTSSSYIQSIQWVPISGGGCQGFLPAKKGDICGVYYSANGTTNGFRFIYAQKTN